MHEDVERILKRLDILDGPRPQTFRIPVEHLPRQRVDGKLITRSGIARCELLYKQVANQGEHSLIQQSLRQPPIVGKGSQLVIVKRPRHPSLELAPEAILQSIAYEALERDGIHGAVSQVYDIFLFANEVRFSMELIRGVSAHEFLATQLHTPNFQAVFLDIFIQIAILLESLVRRTRIDHRDMKLDNIWIREGVTPVRYTFRIDGRVYTYHSNIQVVLLDFGFACIGSEGRAQILNLGGVIPDIDPCPKDGRDMYHILNRLLEPRGFKEGLEPALASELNSWLHPYGAKGLYMTHLTTSHPEFRIPQLMPLEILAWWIRRHEK